MKGLHLVLRSCRLVLACFPLPVCSPSLPLTLCSCPFSGGARGGGSEMMVMMVMQVPPAFPECQELSMVLNSLRNSPARWTVSPHFTFRERQVRRDGVTNVTQSVGDGAGTPSDLGHLMSVSLLSTSSDASVPRHAVVYETSKPSPPAAVKDLFPIPPSAC